jgi:hypothetical protein
VCWRVFSQASRMTRRSHLPRRSRCDDVSYVAIPIQWGCWACIVQETFASYVRLQGCKTWAE